MLNNLWGCPIVYGVFGLSRLIFVAIAALWQGSRPLDAPPKVVKIVWMDAQFREELVGMFPCDVIGLEVVTEGYAPGEPVKVSISGEFIEDAPEIFFPLVDRRGTARMHFQRPACRAEEEEDSCSNIELEQNRASNKMLHCKID